MMTSKPESSVLQQPACHRSEIPHDAGTQDDVGEAKDLRQKNTGAENHTEDHAASSASESEYQQALEV